MRITIPEYVIKKMKSKTHSNPVTSVRHMKHLHVRMAPRVVHPLLSLDDRPFPRPSRLHHRVTPPASGTSTYMHTPTRNPTKSSVGNFICKEPTLLPDGEKCVRQVNKRWHKSCKPETPLKPSPSSWRRGDHPYPSLALPTPRWGAGLLAGLANRTTRTLAIAWPCAAPLDPYPSLSLALCGVCRHVLRALSASSAHAPPHVSPQYMCVGTCGVCVCLVRNMGSAPWYYTYSRLPVRVAIRILVVRLASLWLSANTLNHMGSQSSHLSRPWRDGVEGAGVGGGRFGRVCVLCCGGR